MLNTKDFYFAAYLIAKGCRMKSYSRDAGITTFYFHNDENTADLSAEYYDMKGAIEPITYGNAQRNLKSIIHRADTNSKDNNHESKTGRR